jgi:hypothetical protein
VELEGLEAVWFMWARSVAVRIGIDFSNSISENSQIYTHEGIQKKTPGEGQTVLDAIRIYLNRHNDAPPPAEESEKPQGPPKPSEPRAF